MSPARKPRRELPKPPLRRMSGEELRAWREKYNLTQQELAFLLGVRHSTISRWETEKHPIPGYLSLLLECIEEKILNSF